MEFAATKSACISFGHAAKAVTRASKFHAGTAKTVTSATELHAGTAETVPSTTKFFTGTGKAVTIATKTTAAAEAAGTGRQRKRRCKADYQ
jgi:hypothetical protein